MKVEINTAFIQNLKDIVEKHYPKDDDEKLLSILQPLTKNQLKEICNHPVMRLPYGSADNKYRLIHFVIIDFLHSGKKWNAIVDA